MRGSCQRDPRCELGRRQLDVRGGPRRQGLPGRDDPLEELSEGADTTGDPVDQLVLVQPSLLACAVGPRVGFADDADDVARVLRKLGRDGGATRPRLHLGVADARAVELLLAGDLRVDHRAKRHEQGAEPDGVPLERTEHGTSASMVET